MAGPIAGQGPQHAVVVPVKPPAVGKSRLVGLSDVRRRELAAAFALDTLAACLLAERVAAVLVVTDDVTIAGGAAMLGCVAIPDGVSGDLNTTLRLGAAEARRRWPLLGPVALLADLPALRPDELDLALSAAERDRPCFVADAERVGTTLYAAPYDAFDPCFGGASRAAHLDAGARELTEPLPSLRRDVDDLAGLELALSLGVGPRTAALAPTH